MTSSVRRLDTDVEVPPEAYDDRIVDLDFHVNPMEDELMSYVEDDRARDKLTTEFGSTPVMGKWDAAYAIKEGNEGLYTQGRAEHAEDVHEACEMLAVDEPIVNPGINNLNLQHHPVLKNAVCQAANDYMLDNFVDEGIYTSMMLPKWDPEYAVEELDRVGEEDGVVAAYSWFDPKVPWGNEQFDPVFEKLVELDFPLMLHGSLSYWPQHSYIGDDMLTWTEILGFDWPIHGMVNVINMIMRGVFDRFPDLNVVIQEAGHWWVPFLRYRMDEFYEMHPDDIQITPRKMESGEKYLNQAPSEYLKDNFYLCTQPFALPRNSGEASKMLDLSFAEEMFVYSSDWPHQTLDPPTWFYTSRAFSDDEDLRNAVLHGNADEILNI
ncbi:Amidohydrolase [Halopenitus malekzadehii]|uniref:Amidohydrolase n=1 Tax=Halopenitus malekzadehii TaxID=1267564 RepID=A0A1H6JSS3_9EURY|nr:amidohydrolase family protein [Halopenitus malekzadehii]SEH65621.1 Amidohydrolase [Halopenitus malekzadehii]